MGGLDDVLSMGMVQLIGIWVLRESVSAPDRSQSPASGEAYPSPLQVMVWQ
jgi:hypothetical protein